MDNSANKGEPVTKKKRGPYKKYTKYRSRAKIPCSTKQFWKSKIKNKRKKKLATHLIANTDEHNQLSAAEPANEAIQNDLRVFEQELESEDLDERIYPSNHAASNSSLLEPNEASSYHAWGNSIMSGTVIEKEEQSSCDYTDIYTDEVLVQTLLIMATKMRHSLTYTAAQDIVRLLCIMPGSSMKKTSKYYWKKIIDDFLSCMRVHHLCPECGLHLGVASGEILLCEHCDTTINVKTNINAHNIFVHLSLAQQLKEIFEVTDAHNQCRQKREKICEYGIEDIADGYLYKQKVRNDMISINFSVDGVPVFDSSKSSIYPILCTVNEIDPKQRKYNVILCSLWFGPGKPNMNEYLKPFVAESKTLYTQGFSYKFEGSIYTKKCLVLMCISDSVARPLLRNSYQFNGAYGCGLCLNPGETVPKGRGTVRVYPLDDNGKAFGEGLRTHGQTLENARNKEKGIKGPSVLCDIPHFDIIKSLDADWMHCVSLGVCRQFSKLWFDSSNHDKDFYFGHLVKDVDSFLLSFRPSLEISRTPRRISDQAYWKAHEWVVFLLFYSLPILRALVPGRYVKHWALLVDGVSTLLQASIMPSEIEFSRKCFIEFIHGVQELYGKENLSFNVHLLAHLPESVSNWGPLWTHSAFPYENANQDLLSFVKSSNGVAHQICDQFRLKWVVERLYNVCSARITDDQNEYLLNTLNKNKPHKVSLCLQNVSMLGSATYLTVLPRDQYLALQRSNINIDERTVIQCYKRAIINNELIHSKQYSRVQQRASYYVLLQNQEIFEIDFFLVISISGDITPFAIGRYFEKKNLPFIKCRRLKHLIVPNKQHENLAVINTSDIKEKVTFIEISSSSIMIACAFPSHYELLT